MKRGARYSDDELFRLIKANRGFGLDRMVAVIYDMKPNKTRSSNRFTETLEFINDYKEFSGEDLYEYIQDPSVIKMVTRDEWNKATNNAPVPSGSGLSTSRVSKLETKVGHGSNARDIPLPPLKLNWDGIIPLMDRE